MSNIYMKLSKASQSADKVIKSPKKGGMFFNALEHDEVQKVAMAALNEHGLYPVCNYENIISDRNVFIKCEMTIHDIETKQYIVINGCSAFGDLDKYGTGKAMSYSKKYAFLNALNLETGLDNDDGKKAKPFKAPSVNPVVQSSINNLKKISTTKLANDWIVKLKEIAKDEIKAELITNTNNAVEKGAFGIPTFFANGEMFYGKESLRELKEMAS